MREWSIWAEGYKATGQSSDAVFLGTQTAETFDEAVEKHIASASDDERKYYSKSERGYYTMWGCRIYDNETDARKAFG